jgi:hypothetical protein
MPAENGVGCQEFPGFLRLSQSRKYVIINLSAARREYNYF